MSLFLKCIKGIPVERPPVWFMRQAGRYLSEYKNTRRKAGSFLNLCYNSDLATEVTLQPIEKFGFDAAILFADILLILDALGVNVQFVEGQGPLLDPIKSKADIQKIKNTEKIHSKLSPVYDTVKKLKNQLPAETPLIGFAGAPWTLATYLINGRGQQGSLTAKRFLIENNEEFEEIINLLTEATIEYLVMQIKAGADVIKIFDSWAGALNADMVRRYSLGPINRIVNAVKSLYPDIPFIVFPRSVNTTYSDFCEIKEFDVLAVDQFLDRKWIAEKLQPKKIIQGNLDPLFLTQKSDILLKELKNVTEDFKDYPYVFNLGHGITPDAKVENVSLVVDYIKGLKF
ncbi:MAG: uroporphyrinogen decarboxylase [Rhodobacteraceae bacterium]|nr:uroporphyrinogen decarboxylase [Paracoccaceae bacterium]